MDYIFALIGSVSFRYQTRRKKSDYHKTVRFYQRRILEEEEEESHTHSCQRYRRGMEIIECSGTSVGRSHRIR